MRHIRIWVAGGVVLTAVAGVMAATLARAPSGGTADGPNLDIALRTAPERPVIEGGVLDVGQLTDGYVHDPSPRIDDPLMIDAYLPDEDDTGGETTYAVRPVPEPVPMPERAVPDLFESGRPLSFGFDAPRADYAAERAARVEALDRRLEAARTAEERAAAAETFY